MEIKEVSTEVKEFEIRYQAVDDLGRPLGAEQVFRGKSQQEVLDKVAEANKNLIKLNRELNRKIRLGEFEQDQLPPEASKITNTLLQPKQLSPEEKAQFARDILDPEKFDSVNEKLIEAQLGAKPEDIRNRINRQEQRLADIEAKQEAEAFAYSNPDYYICPENFRTITSWMVKNNLSPVRENFQLAYDKLKAEGLMVSAPLPVPDPVQVQAPVHVDPAPAPVPVQREEFIDGPTPVRQPSGLTREISSPVGTPVNKNTLTRRDIEKMPSDEYKRRILTDRNFAKQVDELYGGKK